jgi:RNA polymerase sigma-70 factor, ECF subfamily
MDAVTDASRSTTLSSAEDPALDRTLVARMAERDEQALGTLFDRWSTAVESLLNALLRDATEVEELVSAVFWQAWEQAGRYAPERGTPGAWLLTIARSRALDRVRARRRQREDAIGDELASLPHAAAGDPAADTLRRELQAHVATAMAQLPPEQRDAVALAYFSGLSHSEIAERLGDPLGTVKTRVRLGLRKLRDLLHPLHDAPA